MLVPSDLICLSDLGFQGAGPGISEPVRPCGGVWPTDRDSLYFAIAVAESSQKTGKIARKLSLFFSQSKDVYRRL